MSDEAGRRGLRTILEDPVLRREFLRALPPESFDPLARAVEAETTRRLLDGLGGWASSFSQAMASAAAAMASAGGAFARFERDVDQVRELVRGRRLRLPRGNLRELLAEAPAGPHDDTVMALSLAMASAPLEPRRILTVANLLAAGGPASEATKEAPAGDGLQPPPDIG